MFVRAAFPEICGLEGTGMVAGGSGNREVRASRSLLMREFEEANLDRRK